MRLAIVQFGDYREAFRRFRDGGPETYYAQRYSVDFVEDLAGRSEFVGVCSFLAPRHEEELAPHLHAAGIPLRRGQIDVVATRLVLERWRVTHLILQTPSIPLIRWALARGKNILPLFADSWEQRGLKSRFYAFRLARLLNDRRIEIVANHNVPASLSLKRIGVSEAKIVPWDWPHARTPDAFPPKTLPSRPSLLFVGAMTRTKGPGECIEAARLLAERNIDFDLTMIGGGDFEPEAARMVAKAGLESRVSLLGKQPNAVVIERLREASIAVVPSHHSYPEGLPMTLYEALATRTPLVLSDHPMFRLFFGAATAARIVPEKDPSAMASAIGSLLSDANAYASASKATAELWCRIKGDLTWGDVISAWLADPTTARSKLAAHTTRFAAYSAAARSV